MRRSGGNAASVTNGTRASVRRLGSRLPLLVVMGVVCAGCAGHRLAGVSRPSREAYAAYLRGSMLERSLRLSDALAAYHSARNYDAQSPHLHTRLGATYIKLGRAEEAMRFFSKALQLRPNDPEALRWLGMVHTSQGRLTEATEAYERLLQVEPTDRFVMGTLADLYVLQGELPTAIERYQQLIRRHGPSSQLHFNLGVLYGRMGKLDDALVELSRAFEHEPASLEIRVALGLTYELSGRLAQAQAHYTDAIRLDPLNPKLYHHAARAALSAGGAKEAALLYQTILDLVPHDADALMGVVRVWIEEQEYDQAQRLLAKKLRELGEPAELYVVLGILYREAGAGEEAMRAFERAVSARDDYAQGHFYLAAQLDQLGRRGYVREELQRTIELDPNHADALNYLGYLDAEAGENLEDAQRLIERALALDPDNGAYLDSLGWVYFQLGRMDEAIEYLERASRLLETDPIIFDHLGDAYLKRGDSEQAKRQWERALKLDESQSAIRQKLELLNGQEVTVSAP